jgi:hypothetical protein
MTFRDMHHTHKLLFTGAILLLMVLEFRDIRIDRAASDARQRVELDNRSREFTETMSGLGSLVHSEQTLNLMAADSIKKMEQLARQSSENLKTVTGGDSFCYLTVTYLQSATRLGIPFVVHVGKYPLYDLEARIVDLEAFSRRPPTLEAFGDLIIRPGNLAVGKAWFDTSISIPITEPNKQDFNIFFTAKNGSWNEALKFRLVQGAWQMALSVRLDVMPKNKTDKMTSRKVYEVVSDQFPKTELGSDWGR